jgi:hypothetical protein
MKKLLIACCAFLVACGGSDSSGPKTPGYVGAYSLVGINGGGLPGTVFQNSAGRIVITGATMTLRADNSYLETRNYNTVLTSGATTPSSASENGSYAVVGTQLTFTIPASGTAAAFSYTGAVSGNTLSYTFEGISYQYQRVP